MHGLNEFINMLWRGRFLHLSVTSKKMIKDRLAVHNITSERGTVYRMKRTGPRSGPCGTLQLMVTGAELQLFTVTV